MTPEPLLRPLEALLNRNIAASGQAQALVAALDRRSFEIRVQPTSFALRFAVHHGRVDVLPGGTEPADATVAGTPFALAALAAPGGGSGAARVRAAGLTVSGDAEVAQQFQQLLEAARPDLEEELARVLGDAAAHHAARFAREAFGFARRAADTFAQNVGEYLTEESRDLPARAELEQFLAEVDALREAADRFEARLALAEQRRRP